MYWVSEDDSAVISANQQVSTQNGMLSITSDHHDAEVTQTDSLAMQMHRVDDPAEDVVARADPLSPWYGSKLPDVLEGTGVDGVLETDGAGNLKMSLGVRDFFDYFLSAIGEVSPEQAIQEIQRQLNLRLPVSAAEQAMHLLNDYIDYQMHMSQLMAQPLVAVDQQNYAYYAKTMEETFAEVRNMRRQYLSPAAVEAFFAIEEAYSEYAVETIKIRADEQLTDEDRRIKMADLDARMPAYMQQQETESKARAELASNAQDKFNQGWSSDAVRGMLLSRFDSQEVEHMLGYYEHESAWKKRLDQYLARKQQLGVESFDGEARQAQLDVVRLEYFREDELPRLRADEAIAEKLAERSSVKEGSEAFGS